MRKIGEEIRNSFYDKLHLKYNKFTNHVLTEVTQLLNKHEWEWRGEFPQEIPREDRIHLVTMFERTGFNVIVITSGLDEGPVTFKLNWE